MRAIGFVYHVFVVLTLYLQVSALHRYLFLEKITLSGESGCFIIWKELSWSAGKSRASFRNILALLF